MKNVLLVMSGSAIAQAVGFSLSPIISRLFSPQDFGVFGSFGALTGVVAAFVTLDYSQAVMLPKRREDAGQVFLLSCLVTLVVSFLCFAICLIFPRWVLGMLNSENIWLLPLFVLAVCAAGLGASFQAWCIRIKAFKSTSASQVVRGVTSNSLQLGLGVLHTSALGLVASSVAADLLACLSLFRAIRAEIREYLACVRWENLVRLARTYGDFPAFSATQSTLNALSHGLPVIVLTHFFGIAVAGAYAFSVRLLYAPMSLIVGALRQVLLQKASETQHQDGPLMPLYTKSTLALFAIGMIPTIIFTAWGPLIFTWVFGAQWQFAGELAPAMMIWLLFAFCNLPAVLFARLIRIQRAVFFYDIVLLAARTGSLFIGGIYLTAAQTVLFFCLVGALLNLALIVFVARAVARSDNLAGSRRPNAA